MFYHITCFSNQHQPLSNGTGCLESSLPEDNGSNSLALILGCCCFVVSGAVAREDFESTLFSNTTTTGMRHLSHFINRPMLDSSLKGRPLLKVHSSSC